MGRLTEKDVCGHWRLKGLQWKNLYEGTPITRETYEALYGALCKLLDYEETGLTPEEIEMRTYCTIGTPCEFQSSEIRKDGWIPVEERLGGVADGIPAGLDGDFLINHYWDAEPDIARITNEIQNRAARLKCLGNAVVPHQFYPIFDAIAKIERRAGR